MAFDVALEDSDEMTLTTFEELDTISVTTLLENETGVLVDEGPTPDVDVVICPELSMTTVSTTLLGETGTKDGAISDDAGLLLSDEEVGAEDDELGLAEEVNTTADAGDDITEVE